MDAGTGLCGIGGAGRSQRVDLACLWQADSAGTAKGPRRHNISHSAEPWRRGCAVLGPDGVDGLHCGDCGKFVFSWQPSWQVPLQSWTPTTARSKENDAEYAVCIVGLEIARAVVLLGVLSSFWMPAGAIY